MPRFTGTASTCFLVAAIVVLSVLGVAGILGIGAGDCEHADSGSKIFPFLAPTIVGLMTLLRSEMNSNRLKRMEKKMDNQTGENDE